MERDSARDLACYLSICASESLHLQKTYMGPDRAVVGEEVVGICERTPLTAEMASDPWQAYNLALHNEDQIFYATAPGIESLLATMPIDYKLDGLSSRMVGPYADSLVAHLSGLIDIAEKELLIVAPYWSVRGVSDIARRINKRGTPGLKVTVLVEADSDASNTAGAADFCSLMTNKLLGQVTVKQPRKLKSGFYPTLHAKVIVVDRKRAYVGSANFSESGLKSSIEMGVGLTGTHALQVAEWFDSLMVYFEPIEFD
jgi:phosphatidylserine/phosphatidylglycerophosphate/cardiolipin synthase-like enzyme